MTHLDFFIGAGLFSFVLGVFFGAMSFNTLLTEKQRNEALAPTLVFLFIGAAFWMVYGIEAYGRTMK
jgi:hypothetical protein